jgi:Ca-activated chloride channel homolog
VPVDSRRAFTAKTKPSSDRKHTPTKGIVLSVLLFVLSGFAASQVVQAGHDRDQENFRISVDVDLVVLQATVRDREGHTVMELGQRDFQAFEDGRLQAIRLFRHEDTPVTAGLVIDHGGSMREKLADVTAGAQAFVHSSNPQDQMFVVNFNETVSLGLPIGILFSDNAERLGGAIWGAPAIGTTALYDAIIEALTRLQQGTSDKKVLIVISDGGDKASKAGLEQVLKMAEQSSAMIYTIGIFEPDDPDRNPKVLQRLAQETGGEAIFPTRISETVEICERITRDIRDQYTIGYSSPNASREGTYHKVRLTARMNENGKLSVRTRAGYRAGGAFQPPRDTK